MISFAESKGLNGVFEGGSYGFSDIFLVYIRFYNSVDFNEI